MAHTSPPMPGMPRPVAIASPHVVALYLVASVLLSASAAAQVPSNAPAPVRQAQALLQAGRADSAVRVLEPFVAGGTAGGVARMLLADAYRAANAPDKAIAMYAQVSAPPAARATARFRSAWVEAGRGRRDAAFAFLQEVRSSGVMDMELVMAAPQLEALRDDPRWARLPWRAEEFQHPFVEPVRIIHEWTGEAKGDQFSWIARGIGDTDGDGVSEVVTSAPTHGGTGSGGAPGRVYVYSGRTGKLLWQTTGKENEQLGTGLEGAGDVNGDGAGDVIAGAPGARRAYVFSGRDGRVLHTFASSDTTETFGSSASSAGDQDGDGVDDVIVGAPGAGGSARPGRAYVYSGRSGQLLFTLDGERVGDGFGSIVAGRRGGRGTPLIVGAPSAGERQTGRVHVFEARVKDGPANRRARFTIDSDSTGAALGAMFASVVGDVDGDRIPDVYASDFPNSARGPSTGRVYVHSGKDGRRLLTLTGENAGDGYGIGSADVGDVNGDGFDDLLVGAWQYGAVAPSGGRVYLHSGKDGSLLRTVTGRIPGETLGFDATGIGDVDGDGTIDLLVTSSWSNVKGFRAGRMYVISGR